MPRAFFALLALASLAEAQSQRRSSWLGLSEAERARIEAHAEAYKTFMNVAKSELSFVREAVRILGEAGVRELEDDSRLTPGARFYDVNRDRTLTVVVAGRKSLREGFQIVGAHIDSPRLELKARPLYEKEGFVLFQTNHHGGIKTYQWTNLPLALLPFARPASFPPM